MKLIHQFLLISTLLLISTSALQSAPKAFDSMGNGLEVLQKDCKQYLKDPNISKQLQKKCRLYNARVTKAFKVGYPLDASVDNGTASEKKLDRYLSLLRKADESQDGLRELMRSQKKKKAEEKKAEEERARIERKAKFDKQINEYKKACDGGDAKVCYAFGVMFYEGQVVKQDHKEAARLYGKACDNGFIEACTYLGLMFVKGVGVEKDDSEAFRLFRKACNASDDVGCKNYEIMQEEKLRKELRVKSSKEKIESREKFRKEYPHLIDQQKEEREKLAKSAKEKRLALVRKANKTYSSLLQPSSGFSMDKKIHAGETKIIEYSYLGSVKSREVKRNIAIGVIFDFYPSYSSGYVVLTIKNLGFEIFYLQNNDIFHRNRDGSVIGTGGLESGSLDNYYKAFIVKPSKSDKIRIDLLRDTAYITIKKRGKDGLKTILTLIR